jgi:uncharacterized membrane protein HdeD (DUF308 family)
MVFALLAVAWSNAPPAALARIFGVFAVAEGVLALLATAGIPSMDRPWPLAIEGTIGMCFGIVALVAPFQMLASVAWLIASWIATVGVLEGATALRVPGHIATPKLFGAIAVGSLLAAFGVVMSPWVEQIITVWLLGAWAAFLGALTLVIAKVLRRDVQPRITPFEMHSVSLQPARMSRPSRPSRRPSR